MRLRRIPLLFPSSHEFFEFRFRIMGIRIEIRKARILELGANVTEHRHPVLSRTIVCVRVDDDSDPMLSLLVQFRKAHGAQRRHNALPCLGLEIEIDRNCPNVVVVHKQHLEPLFDGINVLGGEPFVFVCRPFGRCPGLGKKGSDDALGTSCLAFGSQAFLKRTPGALRGSFGDRGFVRVVFVVHPTKLLDLLLVEDGHLLFKTDKKYSRKEGSTMDTLTPVLTSYLDVSRKLSEVNARASELRDRRNTLELDLAAAYNEAQRRDPLPDKIELKASRLVFQVKKPGEWKKGWTLSKKQLQEYLLEILPEHGEDVMREIVRRHEPKLTATDYAFDLKALVEEAT